VLLRHAEPEIDRQRQGRDQLSQAQAHLSSGYPGSGAPSVGRVDLAHV
jgi:hypothetical protein